MVSLVSGSSGLGFAPWPGTLCCVLGQDTTLIVPLSTQVYKWVLANLMLGVTLRWTGIPSRGVEILLVASCYRNRDKLRPDGKLGSYADFISPLILCTTFPKSGSF